MSGGVILLRAHVAGNTHFRGTQIDGRVNLQSARIEDGLFWQGIKGKVSTLDLTEAQVGVLRDDAESWQKTEKYHLSGFYYDRLLGPLSLSMRRDWLANKHEEELSGPNGHTARDFDPQHIPNWPVYWISQGTGPPPPKYSMPVKKLRQVALPRALSLGEHSGRNVASIS